MAKIIKRVKTGAEIKLAGTGTEIERKYTEVKLSLKKDIGAPDGAEQAILKNNIEEGRYQRYKTGEAIYWSPNTGAHLIFGLIKAKWERLGCEQGGLGYPTTDETPTGSAPGRYNNFQRGGIIMWKEGSREAFCIWGAIYHKWAEQGYDVGPLGFPLSDELDTQGTNGKGKHQKFEGGIIYWTPDAGTRISRLTVSVKSASKNAWFGGKTAIVLSGGGARGDFQLGALAALYEAGIRPDIVCGTSVGALNGLMLAHGETGLDKLKNIWFGLRRNEHMYVHEPWYNQIHPLIRSEIDKQLHGEDGGTTSFSLPLTGMGVGLGALLGGPVLGTLIGLITSNLVHEVEKVLRLLTEKAKAIYNIEPIKKLFATHVDMGQVSAWVATGKQLRFAMVGLESGEVCYVTETGQLLDRDQHRVLAQGISLQDGAMASSSIGGVFPPVNFAGDAWVDGGHRENLPLRAAIDAGATRIYVIAASPLNRTFSPNFTQEGYIHPTDFEQKKVIDIATRAVLDTTGEEVAFNDVFPFMEADGLDIKLISPQFPTHDIITIDPELIRINYHYGYRVASDVISNVAGHVRDFSDQIALKQGQVSRRRKKTWRGLGIPFSADITPLVSEIGQFMQKRREAGAKTEGSLMAQPIAMGDDMKTGELLLPNQSIVSSNGQFTLIYQTDGNLVLYRRLAANAFAEALWASNTSGKPVGFCVMQRDGNLVIYDLQMQAIWAANPGGIHQDGFLQIQADGKIVLNSKEGQPYWTNGGVVDTLPQPKSITINNRTNFEVTVRFYAINDSKVELFPALFTTLPNGTIKIPAQGMRAYTLPTGMNNVKVTFNGIHMRTAAAEETLFWDTDERVRVSNKSSRPVTARFYNAKESSLIVMLPNGEQVIQSNQDIYWQMPDDITQVTVTFNGGYPETKLRGGHIEYTEKGLLIINESSQPITVQFFNEGDPAGGAKGDFSIPIPLQDRNISSNGNYFYTLPIGANKIDVRFVQPFGRPKKTALASSGTTLIYDKNSNITSR